MFWAVTFFVACALVLMAVAPVFLGPVAQIPLYAAFSSVCHQIADRSFQVDGVSFAACHRCFGLYTGFAAGLLVAWPIRVYRRWLLSHTALVVGIPSVLAGMEWTGAVLGIWTSTAWSRLATGALIGLLVGVTIGLMTLTTKVLHIRSPKERRFVQTTITVT
jgi:uncharacterized membrane protein